MCQVAFITHLLLLSNSLEKHAIIRQVTDADIARFNARFKSAEAVHDHNVTATTRDIIVNPPDVQIGNARSISPHLASAYTAYASLIEADRLDYLRVLCARFGFLVWAVDFTNTPYSPLNTANHLIAIDSFRHLMIGQAYAFLAPNMSLLTDMQFLVSLYDHIVHYIHARRFMRNAINPGSVLENDQLTRQLAIPHQCYPELGWVQS